MCEGGYEPVGNIGTYGTRSKVVENCHRPSKPTLDGKTRTLKEDDDNDGYGAGVTVVTCYSSPYFPMK